MLRETLTARLLLLTALLLPLPLYANHYVGEPELERSLTWELCCKKTDCIVTPFTTWNTTPTHTLTETADGIAWIDKDKFKPVPSQHPWVCYEDVDGPFTDDNVRCILYQQNVPLVLVRK